nr:RNA-directed DNA polymerase, eukaryota [Tanacetum cinerariifolium]
RPVIRPVNLNIDVQELKGTDQAKSQSRSEGLCSLILEETQSLDEHLSSEIHVNGHEQKKAVLSWRSSRCFPMNYLSLNIQGLGSKAKKERIRDLNIKHKVNFLTLQETKMDSISSMDVKLLWGNYNFDHVFSEAVGNSGGILCTWDSNVFHKEQHIISDNFVALYGTWNPNKAKLLMISIYALQLATGKRSYITSLITRWNGDCMVMGDFNEVRCTEDRMGSVFNVQRANEFNNFISNSRLVEVQLEDDRNGMVRFKKKMQFLEKGDSSVGHGPKTETAIEGDENSKFFYGIINRKRVSLAIKGVMVDGEWMDDPSRVKEEFRSHFATRFQAPGVNRSRLKFRFPNRLNPDQVAELENPITKDEIHLCVAVEWFFDHSSFTKGWNSSFVALIPKTHDPKFVSDYRPINLIESLYKVVTKILATRLSMDISDLISGVQTAFLPNRQILDGPFSINKLLSWCKHKKQQAMMFRVDFAKAYDSISPTSEFQFHCGLKQRDPLAPYLFILIIESLHLSFSRAVDTGIFTGIKIDSSLMISHIFYVDDAVFIGEWSNANLTGITHILHCFSLLSGLKINLKKATF